VIAIGGTALFAAGCSSGGGVASAPTASTPSVAAAFRAPQIMRGSGLDSVIGERAGTLTRRFGEARIDLAEGDARKLQYVSDACVLDIYLYPLSANAEPIATHVEARARQGGAPADRAYCIAEVENQARS
jgi:hypothetical protein